MQRHFLLAAYALGHAACWISASENPTFADMKVEGDEGTNCSVLFSMRDVFGPTDRIPNGRTPTYGRSGASRQRRTAPTAESGALRAGAAWVRVRVTLYKKMGPFRLMIGKGFHLSVLVIALHFVCPRGDLNPHARNRALAPQASASTIPPPGQ